jgi:predicted RNase H-like HicB family nuclease
MPCPETPTSTCNEKDPWQSPIKSDKLPRQSTVGRQNLENLDRYTYREEWSEEDGVYIARSLEFPSLSAHGPSPEAALAELRGIVAIIVADLSANGEAIPEPLGLRQYSGRLVLRLPKALHREAVIRAAEEGVSLNQYLLARLA